MSEEHVKELSQHRSWLHKIDKALWSVEWQLKDMQDKVSRHDTQLSRIVKADEIADAVSKELKGRAKLELTVLQKIGGLILFALVVTDFIRSL